MNTAHTEILAAINTNDLRAIERALNARGIEADLLDRNTDRERLHVQAFGTIVFDGRSEDSPGYYVMSLDSTDLRGCDYSFTPEELADSLAEIVGYAQQVAQ